MRVAARYLAYLMVILSVATLGIEQQAIVVSSASQSTREVLESAHYFSQDLILVNTYEDGLLRATNEGWHQIYPEVSVPYVSLGGAIYLHNRSAGGIERTLDGGETWTLTGTFSVTDTITDTSASKRLCVSPVTDTVFMVVSYFTPYPADIPTGGIYKSTDGGATWREVVEGNFRQITFSPNFAEDGIAFTWLGEVWKTEDWGETWFPASEGSPRVVIQMHSLYVSPQFAQDGTVFVHSNTLHTYKSTDGGASWFEVADVPGCQPVNLAISPDYIYDQTLLTGDYSEGLLLSQDGGESWQRLDFKLSPRRVGIRRAGPFHAWPALAHPGSFAPGENRVYLPFVSNGPRTLELWVVAVPPWPGSSAHLYHSRDYGASWEEVEVFDQLH